METLPEELLIEIFNNLPPTDLLSIALTCKSFSHLVDNTKLCKKLTIYFPNSEFSDFWDANRRYTKIQITTNGKPQNLIPSRSFNEFVKILTIKNVSITGDILSKMLELCENVDVVRLDSVNYHGDVFDENIKLQAVAKLNNLKLELVKTEFEVLKFFENCKVKELILENYLHHHEDANLDALVDFLKKQNDLKELTMQSICQNFFYRNKLRKVNFKLEKMTIREILVPRDENFEKFLSNHFGSLKIFEIEKTTVPNLGGILRKLKKLKELKLNLDDKIMRTLPILEKVERLTVSRKRMPKKWLEKYPNLKKFKLDDEE